MLCKCIKSGFTSFILDIKHFVARNEASPCLSKYEILRSDNICYSYCPPYTNEYNLY